MKQSKQFFRRLLAVAFWLAVWQAAAMAIGQEVFLVSPVQALCTLVQLLPRAYFLQHHQKADEDGERLSTDPDQRQNDEACHPV